MTQPMITDRPVTDWAPPSWGSPATPPPAKRKIGRYILGGFALLVIIGLASGGDEKDSSSSENVAITTPTTSAGTRTTITTVAPAAAASSSMATWATRYGSSDSATIGEDLGDIQADVEAMDFTGMGSSCRTLQRHVATAESHLPTPDAQLTSALQSAYGYYDRAMTACISGAANMDVSDLTAMSTYITLATGSLTEATDRLDALS